MNSSHTGSCQSRPGSPQASGAHRGPVRPPGHKDARLLGCLRGEGRLQCLELRRVPVEEGSWASLG